METFKEGPMVDPKSNNSSLRHYNVVQNNIQRSPRLYDSSSLFQRDYDKFQKNINDEVDMWLQAAHQQYEIGNYIEAKHLCEGVYNENSRRTDNLLLLGAIHFQMKNFRECVCYNQQCIRIDPSFAEAYSNLGNALKELGDVHGAIQFYIKAIKLKPRFCDAYNNLASAQIQLGMTQEATETYRIAILLQPSLVDAHSNLGNLYKAQGMMEEAKACYIEAIRLRPDFAIPWSNMAGLMKEEGQTTTAIAYYREAIRLAPDFADAHSNLGNALKEQGLIDQAMECYCAAIKLKPDFAIAHGNLASCYFDMGQLDLATASFKYAIQLEPHFPDAYNNLGNALREKGELDEAVHCYRTALKLKPDHPHAYNNLGNAMKDKGLVDESINCYVMAIHLMPCFAAAHSNLGSVLKEQGKLEQALAHYNKAINIDPQFADAYSNMGNAYKDLGRLSDAVRCYWAAIKVKPSFADAYSNLASTYKDGGQLEEAISCYRKALLLKPDFPEAFANLVHSLNFICDWSTRDADFIELRSSLKRQVECSSVNDPLPSVQPFHALVYPLDLADMCQISEKYAERAKLNMKLLNIPPFRRYHTPKKGCRIHVGYVSSDLGNHPLSHLMQSVFGLHDKQKFQVTCYALSPNDNSVWRQKIESEVECICDITTLQAGEAARLIHNDKVDILINLNGYTKGAKNEIFALQPAPIQVSYMGFCGTMGADYIQYMVADHQVIPERARPHYTESILYMPHSYFVNDHKQSARYILDESTLPTRSHYGVPEGKFVYCNFNQIYKIDPSTFDVWMSILRRVPNSILWLLRFPPAGETNIRAEAKLRGVNESQLHFTNVAPKTEHIKRGVLADLFLDTLSCNAHTTGCDVLWSGTPMLTKAGEKMAARVGSSLLQAVGLPEFVTNSLEEYEEFAVELGLNRRKINMFRQRLSDLRHTAPLFDTKRWVRSFEAGLEQMYDLHQAGCAPTDMDAPDIILDHH